MINHSNIFETKSLRINHFGNFQVLIASPSTLQAVSEPQTTRSETNRLYVVLLDAAAFADGSADQTQILSKRQLHAGEQYRHALQVLISHTYKLLRR